MQKCFRSLHASAELKYLLKFKLTLFPSVCPDCKHSWPQYVQLSQAALSVLLTWVVSKSYATLNDNRVHSVLAKQVFVSHASQTRPFRYNQGMTKMIKNYQQYFYARPNNSWHFKMLKNMSGHRFSIHSPEVEQSISLSCTAIRPTI